VSAVLSHPTRTDTPAGGPVGGHRPLQVLGRGRHSVVLLAQRPGDGRAVALKVAPGASFAAEHALLRSLAHPNIVRVNGHGTDQGRGWMAMEHARGTLADAPVPRPPSEVGTLLAQVAGALAALHARGWVHRDVKPANLLLRGRGGVALADFGEAVRCGWQEPGSDGAVVGSPRYAAPEQGSGAAAHPSADVYSLGIVLFEQLTGHPPFPGTTLAEIAAQHLLAPVPRLPSTCAHWQPLLDAMLAKDPSHRPRAAQAAHFRDFT
jgi:serine/threonine protein kinase